MRTVPLVRCLPALVWACLAWAPAAQAQDIVIGQSVALSGPNADIGRDMRDGALAVFAKFNSANPIGRRVKLVTMDNANNRQRAADNTRLLMDQGAMALFGYNSATNSLDALPPVAAAKMLFLAPFSGSASLRSHPNVYTVRASYKDEVAKIIESKRLVGALKAVVLYYDDEVGRSNYALSADAFADAGLEKPPGVAVKRNGKLGPEVIDDLLKSAPHYVLATTQYSAVGDYLKLAAQSGTPTPVAALSFVNPDELRETVGNAARGTIVSQVMPSPSPSNQVSIPVIRECADALNALNGSPLNYTTLESCVAAKVLVAALRKAGPKVDRESLLAAMGSLGRTDLGGFTLNYGGGNHHGSNWVDLSILSRGNHFVR
jgi:branched-chain amino acid transport system substrate-binding protein